jgi:hypothetical protein
VQQQCGVSVCGPLKATFLPRRRKRIAAALAREVLDCATKRDENHDLFRPHMSATTTIIIVGCAAAHVGITMDGGFYNRLEQ